MSAHGFEDDLQHRLGKGHGRVPIENCFGLVRIELGKLVGVRRRLPPRQKDVGLASAHGRQSGRVEVVDGVVDQQEARKRPHQGGDIAGLSTSA